MQVHFQLHQVGLCYIAEVILNNENFLLQYLKKHSCVVFGYLQDFSYCFDAYFRAQYNLYFTGCVLLKSGIIIAFHAAKT